MDDSFSELPRRSTRRVLLESRRAFESQSPFHHTTGDRKRKLSSGSGGGGGGGEDEGDEGWVRRGGRDRKVTFPKRSSNTLYATQHKRACLHSNTGTVSVDTIVPLRRSKREKRLIFSNLNQQEIYHHMIHGPHYSVVDFSDDDLEPYEKILSPVRRRRRRTSPPHPSPRSPHSPSHSNTPNTGMRLRSSRLEHSVKVESGEDGPQKSEGGGSEEVKSASGEDERETRERDGADNEENEEEAEKELDEGQEDDEEEGEEGEEEEEEEEGGRGYYLRKRRPVVYQPIFQVVEEDTPPKKGRQGDRRASHSDSTYYRKTGSSCAPRAYQSKGQSAARRIRRVAHAHDSSSTSSSGSDSDEARFRRRKSRSMKKSRRQCLPMNFDPSDTAQPGIRDRQRIGASLADIDPMSVNREVTFDSIGGLKQHVRSLKEMILFPLLYPEVFDRFKIQPPRGVLFYGPPGCGKTLVARALANECSKGGKKVAFFMRKGADCLSKWVGESERQLRLLFDQAYQMRPSIIFFDEIDGLAPVRSTRQDQIHSSIVSTLLALMDGLDSRGEVVVIGATNRIDAIDPALRRPGRFDREFLFPLPSREDRSAIISIHTSQWTPPLKQSFISQLADHTVGYCGADLKSLCTEAALSALRRTYPQIYETGDKLVLDVATINIAATDFHLSLDRIVPTAQRSESSCARALRGDVVPLLLGPLGVVLGVVEVVFIPAWKGVERARRWLEVAVAMEKQKEREMEECISSILSHSSDKTSSVLVKPVSQTSSATRFRKSVSSNGSHLSQSLIRSSSFQTGRPNSQNSFTRSLSNGSPMSQSLTGSSHYPMGRPNSQSLSDVFESSQPDSTDRVYFDMTDVANEMGGVEAITMETVDSEDTLMEISDNCEAAGIYGNVAISESSISSSHPHTLPTVHRPRLLLCGPPGRGQSSYLGPALLHALEDIPVKVLDLTVVMGVSSCSPEEALTQLFKEAKRVSPVILYLPQLDTWWGVTTDTFQAAFTSSLLSLPPSTSLIVIATAECPWHDLSPVLQKLFSRSCETYCLLPPLRDERKMFFANSLLMKPLLPPLDMPQREGATQHESLPLAPPPEPRQLTPRELQKIDKQRSSVLRELRIFLREATNKLMAERKFKEFTRPVDPEEVPDYYDIIREPMDLGTVMKKIDEHRYCIPKQWLGDVDLITKNALEYNPAHDSESRLLRHRAVALQDMAHSILQHELNEDFEQQCEDIEDTYRKLGRGSSPLKTTTSQSSTKPPSHTHTHTPSPSFSSTYSSRQGSLYESRRRSLRQKGLQPEKKGFDYYVSSRQPRRERELEDHHSAEHGGKEEMERENESAGELESGWEDEGEGEREGERGGEGEGEMEEGERDSNFETPSTHKSTETRPRVSVHRRRGRKRRNSSLLGRHGNREGSFPTANDGESDGERERESRGRGRESERNDTVVEASNSVKRTCGSTPDDAVATPTVAVPTARIDRSFGGKHSVFDTSRGSVGSGGREGEREREGEGEEALIHMRPHSVLLRNGLDSTAGGFHGNSRSLSAANGSKFVGKSKMFNGIQMSSDSWLEGDSPHDTLPSDVLIDSAVDRGACLTREQNSNSKSTPSTAPKQSSSKSNGPTSSNSNSKSTQNGVAPDSAPERVVEIDRQRLLTLFERVVDETESSSVEQMEKMLSTFNHLVFRYRMKSDRRQLVIDLECAADLFLRQQYTDIHE